MWYPPSVLVPIYLEPAAARFTDVPVTAMWPVRPMKQHLCLAVNDLLGYRENYLSTEDVRKFLLSKSVYDLVKASHFLELTDSKLLGWYLSLPADDRKLIQDEGGFLQFLHRHPALNIFNQIVYLKRNCNPIPALDMSPKHDGWATVYDSSQCVNSCSSCPSGAEKCCSTLPVNPEETVCVPEEENTLWLLPKNVRAELNLLKSKGQSSEDMAMRSSQQYDCMSHTTANLFTTSINHLNSYQQPENPKNYSSDGQMWNENEVQMREDQSALHGEFDLRSRHQSSRRDPEPLLLETRLNSPNPEKDTLPEYYSLNSTTVKCTSAQWCDSMNTSMISTEDCTEASTVGGSVTCVAENYTSLDSVSFLSNSSEWTDLTEDGQNLSSEDELQEDEYHRVNEEASRSPTCVPCIDPSWPASDQTTQSLFKCDGCVSSTSLSELNVKHTTMCAVSPVSSSVCQTVDASNDFRASFTSTRATEITQDFVVKHCHDVSTGTDLCPVNRETQTIPRLTSEKCTITQVCMSDLDALGSKEFEKFRIISQELMHLKDERSEPDSAGDSRNEQCHCGCGALTRARWAELRLLALQFAMCQQHCWRCFYTSPQGGPSLQRIDSVPDAVSLTLKSLEDQYLHMRMKILEGVPLDNLKPLSVDTERLNATTCYRPSLFYEAFLRDCLPKSSNYGVQDECQSTQATDYGHLRNSTASLFDSATSKTVSCKPDSGIPASSQQPELSNDAKPVDTNTKDHFCLLRVSNLPNAVTEHDLLLWFAKYNPNQVSLSKFSNTRVATVSVRTPNDAEASIREMNGQSIQGHTLHVEPIHKPPADGQVTIKESCVKLSTTAHKAASAGEEQSPQDANNFHTLKLLHCSMDKLTNICATPTATGTCVPQHYGTMGSFDTIMAQLLERHSNTGRHHIVSALLKLQQKHHGVLSGLPLREIVEMTSELLLYSGPDQA